MPSKIILFELNEVPFRIIDNFVQWRPESYLARVLPLCKTFDTFAEDSGHLSPWKTWPTLHRGVVADKHLINDFGQDLSAVDAEFPPVWQRLVAAGVPTGIFGSLHTYPMPSNIGNYSFYVPDTFAAGSECFPQALSVYQAFNLEMARESARNVAKRIPWHSALRFLKAAPGLGLTARTSLDLGAQLISERLAAWRRIRRRTYQVVLAFDIWYMQLKKTKPAFSTFFTNHVASSMHRYWAARFPGEYETFGYDDAWVNTYRNEIDFTMATFDRFLGRLVTFVRQNPDYSLWITTSMGQAATQAMPLETQLYIADLGLFMERMGAAASDWKRVPAMLPQYNVVVTDDARERVRRRLGALEIAGSPLSWREAANGFFSLDLGHKNLHDTPNVIKVGGECVACGDLGLENTEIEDKSGSNAYHIPQGSLLIYDRAGFPSKQPRSEISTLEIAPAVLRNFGVAIPPYMSAASPSLYVGN